MRYVALLRGINVGGKNAVPMADLRAMHEAEGHGDVRTYINSGNVIFDAPRGKAVDMARGLESAVEREFGVSTKILVLPGSTVVKVAGELPESWLDGNSRCDVLYLLPKWATPRAVAAFGPTKPEFEEVRYVPGALLSRIDNSAVGRSRLHKFIGTDLYDHVTIRNANTARKLAAMVSQDA